MAISQADLETALSDLLYMAGRFSPPLNNRPGLFLEQKQEMQRAIMELRDRVKGVAPREPVKLTSAEIRHAARPRTTDAATAAAAVFARR